MMLHDHRRSNVGGRAWWPAAVVTISALLVGCSPAAKSTPDQAAAVTVKNCQGKEISFAQPPKRVVTLDGYAAQVMARLGLTDRIVGTGVPSPFAADKEPHRSELGRIKVLARTMPSAEIVAAQEPDLVLTGFDAFGLAPGSPKQTDLDNMKVPGLAACLSGATPGAVTSPVTGLAPMYDFLQKLGQVFRIEERAEQVAADLRKREQAVTAQVGRERQRVLILQDNPRGGQPIKTSGTSTVAHGLILAAGGQNLFTDVTAMHADVSPEQVVTRDPHVIWVITDYPFTRLPAEELVRLVKENPILKSTTAGRQGRVVATSQFLVAFPTPLNVDALEQLGAYLRTDAT